MDTNGHGYREEREPPMNPKARGTATVVEQRSRESGACEIRVYPCPSVVQLNQSGYAPSSTCMIAWAERSQLWVSVSSCLRPVFVNV